jgi:hypothetical protein
VVSAVILGVGVAAAVNRRHEVVQAAHRINRLQPGWLLVALVCEAVSMLVFAELQRRLLREGGVHIGRAAMLGISLAANALALSVPGGPAVSTGWSFAELRRRGAERVLAGWAVLMAGALSSFALFLTLAIGSWVAGSHGPVATLRGLAVGLAAIPVAAVAVIVVRDRRPGFRRWLQQRADHRWLEPAKKLWEQIRSIRPSPRGWVAASTMAALNWMADAGCLAAAIYAIGGGVPWRGILVAYGLGQLAAVLPFTPGGLAVVEASLTAVLIAYGMPAGTAIAAVLVYRIISFWTVVPVGWICYGFLTVAARESHHPWTTTEVHAPI